MKLFILLVAVGAALYFYFGPMVSQMMKNPSATAATPKAAQIVDTQRAQPNPTVPPQAKKPAPGSWMFSTEGRAALDQKPRH